MLFFRLLDLPLLPSISSALIVRPCVSRFLCSPRRHRSRSIGRKVGGLHLDISLSVVLADGAGGVGCYTPGGFAVGGNIISRDIVVKGIVKTGLFYGA
ncbi:hypothetical protein BJY04DRAFT_191772 [Aspergillus karnatakaensis]|uniref:uncharacterized protein n=1 Tax=Aspergillus karnatakaensis TaxID=1810916 RepID=UPI003CCD63CD